VCVAVLSGRAAARQVLELATPCPWKEHLFDLEAPADKPILYVPPRVPPAAALRRAVPPAPLKLGGQVVYPDSGGSWRIQCVPVRPSAFENRKYCCPSPAAIRPTRRPRPCPRPHTCAQTG
jgi:uncharacterized UPF0160 family protein